MESGENLDADIIVTATGLTLVALGDIALDVDGRKINPHELFNYKGLMFNGLPNLAWVIGYTNASWTLRANLSWKYVADYLNYLDKNGYDYGMPDPIGQPGTATPVLDLDSGYIQRASELLPQSGATKPWKVRQNWFLDTWDAQHTDIEEAMVFGNATASRESVEKESPDVLAS